MSKNIKQILLTQNQLDALDNADNPQLSNVYLTENDVKFFFERSFGLSKTTSDIFIDKLSFDINLGSGISEDYIIEWSFIIFNDVNNAVAIQLLQDTEEISSDYCFIAGGGNNTFRLRSSFTKISIDGFSTFQVQFKRDIGGEAKIKKVQVLLRRIIK